MSDKGAGAAAAAATTGGKNPNTFTCSQVEEFYKALNNVEKAAYDNQNRKSLIGLILARFNLYIFFDDYVAGKIKLKKIQKKALKSLVRAWNNASEHHKKLDVDFFYGMNDEHEALSMFVGTNQHYKSYLVEASNCRMSLMAMKVRATLGERPAGHRFCLVSTDGCRWLKEMPDHIRKNLRNHGQELQIPIAEVLIGSNIEIEQVIFMFDAEKFGTSHSGGFCGTSGCPNGEGGAAGKAGTSSAAAGVGTEEVKKGAGQGPDKLKLE